MNDEVEEQRISAAYRRRAIPQIEARYSYFESANLLHVQQLERILVSFLRKVGYAPLEGRRILDVGCGTGAWLRRFILWGARPENLFGIDLQEHRIEAARRSLPSSVDLQAMNAVELPFPDSSFDLVFQFTTFTSILSSDMKRRIAREMVRVAKPGSHVVWYDFFLNNPFNPDVRGIGKREIIDLFPGCRAKFLRVTLAPPVARLLGRISPALCELALRSRLFSTHYLAFLHAA